MMKLIFNNWYQLSGLIILLIISMIINRFAGKAGNEWLFGALILLLFELANPIIGIFAERWWRYTLFSLICFVLLIAGIMIFGHIISKISLEEYDAAMVYLVVMYYPIALVLCGIIRLIVDAAKK